jgi:hypothetical protein
MAAVPAARKSVNPMAALPASSFMPHYTLFAQAFATMTLPLPASGKLM